MVTLIVIVLALFFFISTICSDKPQSQKNVQMYMFSKHGINGLYLIIGGIVSLVTGLWAVIVPFLPLIFIGYILYCILGGDNKKK